MMTETISFNAHVLIFMGSVKKFIATLHNSVGVEVSGKRSFSILDCFKVVMLASLCSSLQKYTTQRPLSNAGAPVDHANFQLCKRPRSCKLRIGG